MKTHHLMPPIAVTGVGALFPGDTGPDDFWKTIVNKRDCITEVPPEHWLIEDYYDPDPSAPGKTYGRRGGFLKPIDFDPIEHGIPPSILPATDTAQLLALIVAKRVIESSRNFNRVDRDRISVILGVASTTELVATMSGSLQQPIIERTLYAAGIPANQVERITERISECYVDWTESTFPGLLGNIVAGRIANRFDLGGTNCVVDAACASSLAAIQMAIDQLRTDAADMVITGGVDALNDIVMYMCFSKTMAMSRTGDCRPFSDDADGTILGEGLGMFALRRLDDAERDGDPIYAVLRGLGGSSDGRAKSIYAPRAEGQMKALRRAYETAGYDPGSVELLEAHGTGTVAGDAAEVAALKEIFGGTRNSVAPWCALGSIKSQIGHTKAAAGSASLYKTIMALHHKALPPTLNVRQPNPALNLKDSPFYLNTETRPWIRPGDHARRAGVSSFGFGGSNFHLTLEEYQGSGPKPSRIRALETELFLFSAEGPDELIERARSTAGRAFETQKTFLARTSHRLAIVASDGADLAAKVDRAAACIRQGQKSFSIPEGIFYGSGAPIEGKTAFLFPGQGSQYVGMTAGLALAFDNARSLWDASADVARKVFPSPPFTSDERAEQTATLTDTRIAQPAIGIASQIYLDILRSAGCVPDLCGGHSFGEVTALYAAGVVSANDFMRIARQRGLLMGEAADRLPGAMAAVVSSRNEIETLMPDFGSDVVIANINSPQQIVLAGSRSSIERGVSQLATRGVTARLLPVSTAFHSSIVEPASAPFTSFIDEIEFHSPQVPVYSNTTARIYPATPREMRVLLGGQLAKPVNFAGQIDSMNEAGARIFIEVGPGSVLTDLVTACLGKRPHLAISTDARGKNAVTGLWFAFARLAAAGVSFDLSFAWKGYSTAFETVPKRSSATVAISGTNFGKKYPSAIANFEVPVADDGRYATIQLIQQEMAEAHASAQRALAESHLAYLKASEMVLGTILNGQSQEAALEPPVLNPESESRALIERPYSCEPQTVGAVYDRPEVSINEGIGLDQLVLSVIAEETGYPVDILAPDMDLEADLGIDSIKRVQILGAVSEKRPDLPVIEISELSGMRTIGAVIARLQGVGFAPLLSRGGESRGESLDWGGAGQENQSVDQHHPGARRHPTSTPGAEEGSPPGAASICRLGVTETDAPLTETGRTLVAKDGMLAVVGCNDGIGAALAGILKGQGIDARVSPDIPPQSIGTIFLDFESSRQKNITRDAQRVFTIAKNFVSSGGVRAGTLLMAHERNSPLRGGIAALGRTVAIEHPTCRVRTIEIERGDRSSAEVAAIIATEALTSGTPDTIRVNSAGARSALLEIERPIDVDAEPALLQGNPVIVASGGARGVTAACLIAAAKIAPLRLALLGRTARIPEPDGFAHIKDAADLKAAVVAARRAQGDAPAPRDVEAQVRSILVNREICRTLESLHILGSDAIYIPVNVIDMEATGQVISEVRNRWGSIDILIHGAGVIADKRIAEKSSEQFIEVFEPKVLGMHSLLDATRNDRLRFICAFSSIAARYGNAGQSDYAMANAVINDIVVGEAARRGPECVVRSLNWGPWDGGMVTPQLRAQFAARGIPVISMEDGIQAFVRELQYRSSDPADVDVVLRARG